MRGVRSCGRLLRELRVRPVTGKVLGRAYIPGIGMAWVSEAESPNYLVLTSVDTGREYHRARANVMWRATAERVKEAV